MGGDSKTAATALLRLCFNDRANVGGPIAQAVRARIPKEKPLARCRVHEGVVLHCGRIHLAPGRSPALIFLEDRQGRSRYVVARIGIGEQDKLDGVPLCNQRFE